MCDAMEYLIRPRDGHDWPAIPKGRLASVKTLQGGHNLGTATSCSAKIFFTLGR